MHIVYSVAKIVQPRYRKMDQVVENLKRLYEYIASPEKLIYRGGSYRLPHEILMHEIVEPFLDLCKKHKVPAYFCKDNLLATP